MINKCKDSLIKLAVMTLILILLTGYSGSANGNANALSDVQRNSIAMLNYLTVLTQQINASKNSRIYLEEAYSSLINNTSPNTIDTRTLEQLVNILDTLENYRMIAVKRERLQYIKDQNSALSIGSIVPNPLSVLNIVESRSLPKIALSIVSLAVDSATRYAGYTEQANMKFLEDGWALDDEASAVLHNSRKSAFSYMVSIVNEQDLPGEMALNENYVEEFVNIKNSSNVVQQIQFLESNEATYQSFGDYWLTLAQSYYDHGDYSKCLETIASYELLGVRIFRKDYDYARVLPLVISAAGEIKETSEYAGFAEEYCIKILSNTDNDDWALRYFVAQTYVDLYGRTNDHAYLQRAYSVVLDNVNVLVSKQNALNTEYLAEVVAASIPKDAKPEVKSEIDQYNKYLNEERKTAVSPIYEPLLLNCDLLFMLADELKIDENEKVKIDNILHENGKNIFLLPSVDEKYWFTKTPEVTDTSKLEAAYTGKELSVPVECVSSNAVIHVMVTDPVDNSSVIYDDWTLQRVDRKAKGNLASFVAVYQSPSAQKHEYKEGAVLNVEIQPKAGVATETFDFNFSAVQNKKEWWEAVKLWEDNFTFTRIDLNE